MLDIGWWELFVVGMVALLVVGPKELPAMLRTIGRYVGMIKRQADEFRSQFDEALRESEFNDLKKEMDSIKSDVSSGIQDAQRDLDKEMSETSYDWDKEEKIEPAPEFAGQEETTSFTTADGEVITKEGSEPAADHSAEPAPLTSGDDSKPAGAPDHTPVDDAATTTSADNAATTSQPRDSRVASTRDAEAVR